VFIKINIPSAESNFNEKELNEKSLEIKCMKV